MLPCQPVHTYSIVAYDSATGDLGIAVQSHWFCVGPAVIWAEAGTGVVAVQSDADPRYGTAALDRLRAGMPAQEALAALVREGERPESHQIALLDRHGQAAAHTGPACIPESGHIVEPGFSAQANMMLTAEVWDAMGRAYRAASGSLAERMLAALDAAEACGGDVRGKQSAAIMVVRPKAVGDRRLDCPIDLRVDDHPDPLTELCRLLRLRQAGDHADRGFTMLWRGDAPAAIDAFAAAVDRAADKPEFRFWQAWALLKAGRTAAAVDSLAALLATAPRWGRLFERVAAAERIALDDRIRQLIKRAGRDSPSAP